MSELVSRVGLFYVFTLPGSGKAREEKREQKG
jgi:hypothetical protein